MSINVGFKRLHNYGEIPTYKHSGDAGMDAYLPTTYQPLSPGEVRVVPLGFAAEIPEGFELQVRGRSGLASRGILCHFGTVDSSYRGEIGAILINISGAIQPLNKGDRICQLVLSQVPTCNWVVVDEIDCTERGEGGFGSSEGMSDQFTKQEEVIDAY